MTVVDRGSNIQRFIPHLFASNETVTAGDVEAAMSSGDTKIVICDTVLSSSVDLEGCRDTIARLTSRFRIAVFFEPSIVNRHVLRVASLKSFHEGFASNRYTTHLTPQFLLSNAVSQSVMHFGCNRAYDSDAGWIVPSDFPAETLPASLPPRERITFEGTLFEYSCFVCCSYDAPLFDPGPHLQLLETALAPSPWQVSRAGSREWRLLADMGSDIYKSSKHYAPTSRAAGVPVFDMTVKRIDECLVTGTGGVFSREHFVAESNYLIPFLYGPYGVRDGMQRPHPRRHVPGFSLVATSAVSYNYYHWLAQAMPFLATAQSLLADAACEERITIVTGREQPFHRQMINALFAETADVDLLFLDPSEYVTLENAWYSDVVGEDAPRCLVPEQVTLVNKLTDALRCGNAEPFRRIYISRADAIARKMANEAELSEALAPRGIEVLTLANMTVVEQIERFREATLVIGPHGAGLTNILFSKPGTTLFELRQVEYRNDCIRRLAQNVGVHHFSLTFHEALATEGGDKQWLADIHTVLKTLDQLASAEGYALPRETPK